MIFACVPTAFELHEGQVAGRGDGSWLAGGITALRPRRQPVTATACDATGDGNRGCDSEPTANANSLRIAEGYRKKAGIAPGPECVHDLPARIATLVADVQLGAHKRMRLNLMAGSSGILSDETQEKRETRL